MSKRQIIHDMPEKEYHALERFSSSGCKDILVSSQDFWTRSWMNPNKYVVKNKHFDEGHAYHSRILEGRKVFEKRYAVKPECDKRTITGKKIYAEWIAEFPDAEEVEQETLDEINNTVERIEDNFDYFKGGKPEVTVLWDDEETGVPMKARIDYLKPEDMNDLKTFSNAGKCDINWLLAQHIVKYHYHIQVATYTEALPDHEFNFVFVQTGGINNVIVRKFPKDLLLFDKGKRQLRQGINKFAENYRKFGVKAWYDDFPVDSFTDENFPIYSLED